jgi:hypothetical protein
MTPEQRSTCARRDAPGALRVNALAKKISEKSSPPDRAAKSGPNRSPSQLPGQTAIGTKELGLLFLRQKVASAQISMRPSGRHKDRSRPSREYFDICRGLEIK